MPTAMIVLASEQLWPNLLGLLHFCSQGERIQKLCILHTADQTRSVAPARRLADLCRLKFPAMDIELSGNCSPQPQEISNQIDMWLGSKSQEWKWIINATGGMKISSFGLADFVPSGQGRVRVVYLELSERGQWYEVLYDDKGIYAQKFEVTPGLSHALTLADAIALQTGHQWDCSPVLPLSLEAITRAGIETQWVWNAMAPRFPHPQNKGGSWLYEQFVANTLEQMGIANIVTGVQTNSTRPGEENDVMCLHHDKIYLFDCKLTTHEQAAGKARPQDSSLITEAHDTCNRTRMLGGLRARGVLLRPNRNFSQDEHSPNAKSFFNEFLGLTAWDVIECSHDFFVHVDKLMHGQNSTQSTWSDDLRQAHALFQEEKRNGRFVLWSSPDIAHIQGHTQVGDFWNQGNALSKTAEAQGHSHWKGYFEGDNVYLWLKNDGGWTLEKAEALKGLLSSYSASIIFGKPKNSQGNAKKELDFRLTSIGAEKRQALYRALCDGSLGW